MSERQSGNVGRFSTLLVHRTLAEAQKLNCDLLAGLLPPDETIEGSVSTVPAGFRSIGGVPGAVEEVQDNLLRHAAHLALLRERTGRVVTLALEPEPMCYLETSDELVDFLETKIFARDAVARFAAISRLSLSGAEAALRGHLGICYDVCHAAIEFEDPVESIHRLRAAGIGIFKAQLSAAIRVPVVDDDTRARLRRFDDGVYLHQVVERRTDGALSRYLDLASAFDAIATARGSEWRVHCHVPVFIDRLPELHTTQEYLKQILESHRTRPLSSHLEVETYTFDVLPEELRNTDVATAVARELAWVKERVST
jgi:sugar phosphate isomerase/epimerase